MKFYIHVLTQSKYSTNKTTVNKSMNLLYIESPFWCSFSPIEHYIDVLLYHRWQTTSYNSDNRGEPGGGGLWFDQVRRLSIVDGVL